MTIMQEFKRRGLIAQMSHQKETEDLFDNFESGKSEPVKFYIGFDATADSLHIGSMLQLITMSRLQKAGHYPILLLGTATTLIGDPTGRTDMRQMLTSEQINKNAQIFKEQASLFLDMSEGKAETVGNLDWFADIKYLEFLRDIGRHFSVNKMLTAECFKTRMEKGLSFLEFNYMLLQSYDYLNLYRTKGVKLQLGGDDQWSNILAGADLIRRVEKGEAFAMTTALLSTKEGKKMGKTQQGAIWLNPEKCPPYDFFQHFRNIDDRDVIDRFKKLTFIPVEEIEEMEKQLENADGKKINEAKERLAYELTKMVHGEEEAVKARDAARSLFIGKNADENMPTVTVSESKINILDLLVQAGLCSSKRDARTNLEQGGISVDDRKITDVNEIVEIGDFVVVRKGKKKFVKVIC